MMKTINDVHVFTAGNTVDSQGREQYYSIDDLKELANGYSKDLHEAPIVWGHDADRNWGRYLRKATQLANGWIKSLKVVADRLIADIEVDDATYEAIKDNKLKKRSIAFYQPTSKHNPSPNKWYVRHLALLGAEPPAIKGLADISIFSESVYMEEIYTETSMNKDEAVQALNENASDWLAAILRDDGNGFNEDIVEITPKPAEENNWLWNEEEQSYSGSLLDSSDNTYTFSITKEGDDWISSVKPVGAEEEEEEEVVEQFAEEQADNEQVELMELRKFKEQAEAQLASMKQYMDEQEAAKKEAAYSEIAQFCDGLYHDGRMLESSSPKQALLALLMSLFDNSEVATYSDGDNNVSAFKGVKDILASLPSRVEFSEAVSSRASTTPVVKVPKAYGMVSKEGAEEYSAIKMYMEKHSITDFREGRRQYLSSCSSKNSN